MEVEDGDEAVADTEIDGEDQQGMDSSRETPQWYRGGGGEGVVGSIEGSVDYHREEQGLVPVEGRSSERMVGV